MLSFTSEAVPLPRVWDWTRASMTMRLWMKCLERMQRGSKLKRMKGLYPNRSKPVSEDVVLEYSSLSVIVAEEPCEGASPCVSALRNLTHNNDHPIFTPRQIHPTLL
mmetsp:Transcript_3882/g.14666  ORF Transcript_3882/g.14666 Transcript_3882/m.14666 type:complete len:107 (-) Transcript_3882:7837-8157(-)